MPMVCLCFQVRLGNKYDWWSQLCLLGGQVVSLLRWDFVDFWSFLKFLKSFVCCFKKYIKAGVRQSRTLPNSASCSSIDAADTLPWPEPEFCLQNMNCHSALPLNLYSPNFVQGWKQEVKDFLNYVIIKHSITYSIHIHNFKFLLKACILHIISQNSRTAVCLAFLSVLQLFALNHSAIYFPFYWFEICPWWSQIPLWYLWSDVYGCVCPEAYCRQSCHMTYVDMCGCVYPEACTDSPVITWHMWTCVPRSLYRQSCHHVRYMWTCVPRSLYRQSCRHMNLLFSVSFQVNGDIPLG